MNIPEKVKIGCKDYTVDILDKLLYLEGKTVCGMINRNSCKIEISTASEVSEDSMNLTFFHEVLHGLEDFLDIDLTEEQIEKFAKGLYLFVKENPDVFETARHEEIITCHVCGVSRKLTQNERILFRKGLVGTSYFKPYCECLKDNKNATKEENS